MQKVNSTQSVAKGARAKMHSNLKRQIQIPTQMRETTAGDARSATTETSCGETQKNAGSCKREVHGKSQSNFTTGDVWEMPN